MKTKEGLPQGESRANLRVQAEALIRSGAAVSAKIGGGALGVEALELLYRRASDPEFAADSLKLLHELQTHQVELDVLLEQLQASESEIQDELAHYQALYKHAPIAYLVVSRNGRVIESNVAARSLLGFAPENTEEQTLTQYLVPPGRAVVADTIESLKTSGSIATCRAQMVGTPDIYLSIQACQSLSGDDVMMVLSPCREPDITADLS